MSRGGTAGAFPSPEWSLANSFSTAVDTPPFVFGGGASSGKATFDDLRLERIADQATIKHVVNAITGRHSQDTELDVTAPNDAGEAEALLRYALEDVLVTGVSLKTDAGGNLRETLAVTGQAIEWEYVPGGELAGWDIAGNVKL